MTTPPKIDQAEAELLEMTADLERQVEQLELLFQQKVQQGNARKLNTQHPTSENPSVTDLKTAAGSRPPKKRQ